MKKITLFIFILFLILIFMELYSYSTVVSQDLSNTFFRLHIIANSNSDEDQKIKLKVRDNIMNYLLNKTENYSNISKNDAISIIESNLPTIKHIADSTINEFGARYASTSEIGSFYFPTKHYFNLSLPAGKYDSLKISLGKANGKNWWCSLYPPLCFVDISEGALSEESNNLLKNSLSNDEFSLITSSSPDITFKFKIVELFNK